MNISTGQVNATISGIIYVDKHLAIYKVGKVLVPSEFFPSSTKSKTIAAAPTALAPAPASDAAKAPKPDDDKEKPASSEDSSSQVVPTVTSGGMRISSGMCGSGITWVALVLGVVFVRASFHNIRV